MILLLMGVCGTGKSTIGQSLSEKLQWPFEDGDHYHPASNKTKMSSGTPLNDEDRYEWLMNLHHVIEKWHKSHQHGILVCSALKSKYRQVLLQGSKANYNSSPNSDYTSCKTEVQPGLQTYGDDELRQKSNKDMLTSTPVESEDACQQRAEEKQSPSHVDTPKGQNVIQHKAQHQLSRQCDEQPDVLFVHLKGSFDILASRLGSRKGHFFNPALLQSQFDTLEDLAANENGIIINIDNSVEQVLSDIVECLRYHDLGCIDVGPYTQSKSK